MSSRATIEHPEAAVPVQKDPDILAAATRLAGEDLCSIADLSSAEVRAILKLGHDVKRNPREYRHALDAKQMVLMFEKASLRTRLAFETGINTLGGNADLRRPDQLAARRARVHCRRRAQRGTLGRCHRTAHLRARHHHRDGRQLACPRHKRAFRLRASLPGAGRLHDS